MSAKNVIGSVEISYTTPEKLSDGSPIHTNTISLEIKDLKIKAIKLSQTTLDIYTGSSQSITATATFENDSTLDITNDCNWTSSDSAISSVDKGLVSGISEGSATIVATDSNITSDSLAVQVTKLNITNITIQATKTEFNVEQTIELEAIATTDSGEKIILNNSDVTWQSDKDGVVSIVDATAIATAISKGSAIITATSNLDASLNDTITLDVIKDVYLRVFIKDGEEIEFLEAGYSHTFISNFDKILGEFSLKAVGSTFTVSELSVKDFNDEDIHHGDIGFIDLSEGQEIKILDGKVDFQLSYDGEQEKLRYSFKIDDAEGSMFLQNYQEELLYH